jgi:hypothetical protein
VAPNEELEFRTALNEAAAVVADLPENLQASAFAVVFPLVYRPSAEARAQPQARVAAKTRLTPPTPRRTNGPKSAISALRGEGFFRTPRTVEELGKVIKDSRGHDFEGRQLSTALLRLLRAGEFQRSRNDSGEYCYQETV